WVEGKRKDEPRRGSTGDARVAISCPDLSAHCLFHQESATLPYRQSLSLPNPCVHGRNLQKPWLAVNHYRRNGGPYSHLVPIFENDRSRLIHSRFETRLLEMGQGRESAFAGFSLAAR